MGKGVDLVAHTVSGAVPFTAVNRPSLRPSS